MKNEDFKRLQKTQMVIMDEIHRLCVLNDIHYYTIGGTGIGIVRHHGFIPWDVDIDIGMLRKDYEKFSRVCKEQIECQFEYFDFKNVDNYTRPHAIVGMKGTRLETSFDKYNHFRNFGIYVDILPLDNAPNSKLQQRIQAMEVKVIRKLTDWKMGIIYSNNVWKARLKTIRKHMIFWVSLNRLNKMYDHVLRRYETEDTENVCSMAGKYLYQVECVPKSFFGNPVLMPFEDRYYYAPQKVDEYLKHIYGDYMKLPPKEEQAANLKSFDLVVFRKE